MAEPEIKLEYRGLREISKRVGVGIDLARELVTRKQNRLLAKKVGREWRICALFYRWETANPIVCVGLAFLAQDKMELARTCHGAKLNPSQKSTAFNFCLFELEMT